MKIFVTGTRGIPDIPGGVETHCQHLYPLIVEQGHEVRLSRRDAYVSHSLNQWRGVQLVDIHCPKQKSLETIVHTFFSILAAKKWGADVLHVHAIGSGLLVPFARLLGMTVVITNHGPDYHRQRWGKLAKAMLMLGEYLGGKFATQVIAISRHIQGIVKQRCGRDSTLIYNGVGVPEVVESSDYINSLGVTPGQYMIAVARFVPEKGLHDLIEAFRRLECHWKLVIAGDADHEDVYSRALKRSAAQTPGIILAGYITEEPLRELFSHAGLFVMPSYHEGLPIALLEAMSYGLPVLVSDIPANLEVALGTEAYTVCGNVDELVLAMNRKIVQNWSEEDRIAMINKVRHNYDWNCIALQTIDVYRSALAD